MNIIYYQNTQGVVTAIVTSIPALDVEPLVERLRAQPTCHRAYLVTSCDRVFNVSSDNTKVEVGTITDLS